MTTPPNLFHATKESLWAHQGMAADARKAAKEARDKAMEAAREFKAKGVCPLENADAFKVVDGGLTFADEQEKMAAKHEELANQLERTLKVTNTTSASTNTTNTSGTGGGRLALPSMTEYSALARSDETYAAAMSTTQSGAIAPPQFSEGLWDRLRARNVVLKALSDVGLAPVDLDGVSLGLPKIGTSATADFVAEGATIPASDITPVLITLTPKKCAARVIASSELMADSSPAGREVLAFDLTRTMSGRLDERLLQGSGVAPQPRGIRNFIGIQTRSLGANGATPTLDDLRTAVDAVEAADCNPETTVIFCSPRTWATWAGLKDGQARYVLNPVPVAEAKRSPFGRPVYTSTQIATNETVGTSTDCSWFAVVDLEQVAVGRRQEIVLFYDMYSLSASDQIVVRATSRWDIAPLNPLAVHLTTGVRP